MLEKKGDILQWPQGTLDFSAGCIVMGILNVTPDSFSDGGQFLDAEMAVAHAIQMVKDGAAIIDVGAESTRPGSKPTSAKEQIKRAIPVIKKLTSQVNVAVSIDTCDHEVAKAALEAGASLINDITALSDKRMTRLAAESQVPVVLMHMRGTPETMQLEPTYENVVAEVVEFLLQRAEYAQSLGIPKERIFIDPGIGFGKTLQHNILLLKNLERFVETGYRVLVGTSRKGFIGKLTGKEKPAARVFGTASTVSLAVAKGASIVRVHDVAEMVDVVKVTNAINCRR